jgi:hypothetical protein
MNISEPLPEASAQALEKIFGVHVTDQYAMGGRRSDPFGRTPRSRGFKETDVPLQTSTHSIRRYL